MKKIMTTMMAVLLIFTTTACGGKKMETFGMSAQSFIDSYNASAEKNMLKDPDSPAASLMDLFLFEDVKKVSNPKLDNGKTAEVYESGSVLGDESTLGCKIMTDAETQEAFYVEIWADQELINDKFMPYLMMVWWCMTNTVINDVSETEFPELFEKIMDSTNESGTGFEMKYGKYCFKVDSTNERIHFGLTTSEYADMVKE